VYTAYDDDQFAEGLVPGTRPSILPQYDKEKKLAPKLILGETGTATEMIGCKYGTADPTSTSTSESKEDIAKRSVGRIMESLQTESKEASAYYTKTEFATFNKPKVKKEKKMRCVRVYSAFCINYFDVCV
jgi:hypothetical protein